ncbi:RNB domain-containing ribonuclease [Allofrancisella guangzhouensis]|uniref:Ribonuclease II n=1 Tax=Allofrancisella guangzhouensis TaxID=594679 RepID=A0A0A8E469_9GAMM|nr:RNB domain-containing ribonuclease [Allofrancisella guangzhouensis]AJC48402.1 ribonuclease II [Allofrancisella guangzhouensis]MBK2026897.1 RNB domain-containing ribonuclease [Allofrancisella guangzhouensis]MBK2043553.1 RNB domain-containing ribonuclease [Allofrancisella guangzhouensis]MBK2045485.1 RNB domain-containing ribonuclease [Allofrancisella guangzhouensis]
MQKNSLVIFKSKPAKVLDNLDKKIEIETLDGKKIKLPSRNVQFLVDTQNDFDLVKLEQLQIYDLELTWELLQGQIKTSIEELSELLFETTGVNQAYTIWLLVSEGEFFSFNDDFSISVHSYEQKEAIIKEKKERQKKEQELNDFIVRLNNKTYLQNDEKFLKEIEALALSKSLNCRFFKHLNIEESENGAYKLLLDIGYWDEHINPYLHRYKAELEDNPAEFEYNHDSDIGRVDLTHLKAYAIDDEDSNDPDDAISWDTKNSKMWVHIADPSSSIIFGEQIDLEARARGTNLYTPEKIILMLPTKATEFLGLGLQEISPALSIGFGVTDTGDIEGIHICFSKVKVTRLSYEFAEENMHSLELGNIEKFAKNFTEKRLQAGGVELDFPEAKIKLEADKKVDIYDLRKLGSRILVRDTMLMAGVAVGKFCLEHNITVPFSTQPQHELTQKELENLQTPADMFAARKKLLRGQYSTQPDKHAGMGLENYVQVTSPLRRYLDLLAHYQLRRFLANQELLNIDTINEVIAQVEIPIRINRQTERDSNLHWKLVYLIQNPNMKFKAIVVELLERNRALVSIEKLAMTKKIAINHKLDLNNTLILENTSVNLVNQEAYFKVLENTN